MIKSSLKFLLAICLFSINMYSQTQGTQSGDLNDLDIQFVPDKNSVLNSVGSYASGPANKQYVSLKNIIKFQPTLLGRSIAAFSWEHPFGNTVAIEGGLGLCFGKDYIQSAFSDVDDAFNTNTNANQSYVPLTTILTSSHSAGGPNLFVSAGIKFYFTDIAPEGSYFQFNLRYYSNSLQFTPEDNSNPLVGSPTVTVKNLGLNLIYGYQIVSGRNSNFVQDLFFGFGVRRTAYNGFAIETTTNSYGSTQTVYVSDGSTQSTLAPVFIMGYSLGFGF